MSDIVTEVVNEARYADLIRAHFALSGATLRQEINAANGDGIWFILPGESFLEQRGDPNHGGRKGFVTQLGAMQAALYAMGVDIASDRFTHETRPLDAR